MWGKGYEKISKKLGNQYKWALWKGGGRGKEPLINYVPFHRLLVLRFSVEVCWGCFKIKFISDCRQMAFYRMIEISIVGKNMTIRAEYSWKRNMRVCRIVKTINLVIFTNSHIGPLKPWMYEFRFFAAASYLSYNRLNFIFSWKTISHYPNFH